MATKEQLRRALKTLLRYAERQQCLHEETYRAGFIWTICRICDKKWADDEGGFQPYEEPSELTLAREMLDE